MNHDRLKGWLMYMLVLLTGCVIVALFNMSLWVSFALGLAISVGADWSGVKP